MTAPVARKEDLDLAIELARSGGELSLQWFRKNGLEVGTKRDGTVVTQADRAVERRLREIVGERDPETSIVGEEEGVTDHGGSRRWYFDPIDGTQGFIRGVPLYSTLVALVDEHGPAIGVIYLPALDELVAAGRGLGCTFNGERCRVSGQSELKNAYVTTSAYEDWPGASFTSIQSAGAVMKGWGDGYGYALVATGRMEAMVDPMTSPWDIAPMFVILDEAGGRFTGLDGSTDVDAGTGLGTNGLLHEEIAQMFRHPGEGRGPSGSS